MSVEILSGKVFLLVTGASQGIGQQIAISFGQVLAKGSQILLIARNSDGLKNTASKLPIYLKVTYESVDLSVANTEELDGILKKHLGPNGSKNFNRAVIVHNAASPGDLAKKAADMIDFEELHNYYYLNVYSPIVLNSIFMKIFNDEAKVERLVINMTSLSASEPVITSLAHYGPAKAAREMFFKILARQFPQVNVLNYSPGLVDTEMYRILITMAHDAKDRVNFNRTQNKEILLKPEETAQRLVVVLREQKYKSGDVVDHDTYYKQYNSTLEIV